MRRLYLDTAATMPTNLAAALSMMTVDKIVYGSDCGVPCTTETTMDANLDALIHQTGLTSEQLGFIGHNPLKLFPSVARRLKNELPKMDAASSKACNELNCRKDASIYSESVRKDT
jgi:6-methylsalicylate decarboxylase